MNYSTFIASHYYRTEAGRHMEFLKQQCPEFASGLSIGEEDDNGNLSEPVFEINFSADTMEEINKAEMMLRE